MELSNFSIIDIASLSQILKFSKKPSLQLRQEGSFFSLKMENCQRKKEPPNFYKI